jgi:hypothetical protein
MMPIGEIDNNAKNTRYPASHQAFYCIVTLFYCHLRDFGFQIWIWSAVTCHRFGSASSSTQTETCCQRASSRKQTLEATKAESLKMIKAE